MATATKPPKVHLSLTSWVLGGSLISITGSDGSRRGRKVLINDFRGTRIEERSKPKEKKSEDGKKAEEEAKNAEEQKEVKENKEAEDEKKAEEKKKEGEEKEEEKKSEEAKKAEGQSTDGASAAKKDAKEENEKKAEAVKATAGVPANAEFTAAQDAKILSMKNDNKSWKDIVAEIGGAKKDIVARFKELSSSETGDCIADKQGEENKAENDDGFQMFGALEFSDEVDASKEKDKEKKKTAKHKKEDHGNNQSASLKSVIWASPKLTNLNPTSRSLLPETLSFNLNQLEPELMCQCEECKRDREEEARQEQQHKYHSRKSSRNSSNNNNNNRASTDGFSLKNNSNNNSRNTSCSFDNFNTNTKSQPQIQEEIYSGRLKPNSIWTREDCEVLEELERRYKHNKWLQVQAGFFNWTGRMVEGDIIRRKFSEDGAA